MSKAVNDPFIQGLLHESVSSKKNGRSATKRAPKYAVETEYYFSLAIYRADDPANAAEGWAEHRRIDMLEPNQRYKIVVQCDENPSQPHQQPIKIKRGFTLSLSLNCTRENGVLPFTFSQEQSMLSFSGPFTHAETRYFTVPEQCFSCELKINLSYKEEGKEIDIPEVTRIALSLHGTYTPEDPTWLETYFLDTGLPPHTVVLTAEREGDTRSCQIYGYNAQLPWLSSVALDTGDLINVGKALAQHKTAEMILSESYDFWSSNATDLIRWLKAAHERFGTQFSIVIVDSTDLEIPWELLELDPNEYLGIIALVSRWLPLDFFVHKKLLKVADSLHQGSVISYLDHDLPDIALNEQEALSAFDHQSIHSLERLKARLRRENSLLQVGLVYLGCHGSDGTRLYSMGQRDEWRASYAIKLRAQPEPRPLFFVNACESARIIYREKTQSKIYTFVRSFLLHCASNYIGTIATIRNDHASTIACYVLEKAREANGVQITELLRQVRGDILEKLDECDRIEAPEEECEEYRMLLLSSFLYVYYGNPLARLRLNAVKPAVEEER